MHSSFGITFVLFLPKLSGGKEFASAPCAFFDNSDNATLYRIECVDLVFVQILVI